MRRTEETHPLVIRAESVRLSREAIEALAAEITGDEKVVDGLLGECVDGYFARAFAAIALASLHGGIPVDARHLVEGARLLPDPGFIGKLSAHMTGDVVGGLVGSVIDGRLSIQREAVTLFLAAHWSRERGHDTHREVIVRRTRMCARVAVEPEVEAFVAAAAEILEDDELSRLVRRLPLRILPPPASDWTAPFLELALGPILGGLDDEDEILHPATRRRAVARVGRNEPCPCGSGRKYKRCCAAKDEERLRDSSDIAGVTRAELRLHLEDHLTLERVLSLHAHELARLDPRRVDPGLYGVILSRLIRFEELEAVRDFFSLVGTECSPGHFWDAVDTALRAGKPDAARDLLQAAPPPEGGWLGFAQRLLAASIDDSPALDILEGEVRQKVDDAAVDVACDLLRGPWPSVGILVARGVAPLANPWDREALFEEVGRARDRLDLPAVDPTEEMEDVWGWGEDSDLYDGAPVVQEADRGAPPSPPDGLAQRQLDEKEAEVTRLRRELSEAHRKLDERQPRVAEAENASHTEEPAPGDSRVAMLRERVSRLRSDLSQRHAERNQLRRQLERTQKRVDTLEAERREVERVAAVEAHDDSEASPDDAPIVLSFRIPVFSRRFRESVTTAPDPVRRRAVVIASRIAAGDENAFRGTRRLKTDRDLYRQRIGREHRLLFRMHPQEIEAIDLVPRKELERAIREHT